MSIVVHPSTVVRLIQSSAVVQFLQTVVLPVLVALVMALYLPYVPLLRFAFAQIQYGRARLETAAEPAGMSKGVIIVLIGMAIVGAVVIAGLRQNAQKIQQQMNSDY